MSAEITTEPVYRIKIKKKYYFVKLIHPKLFRHKVREILFFNKSYSEYKSAQFLDRVGLDIVNVIGWGRKGYRNFLVTEDAGLNVVNARDFWLNTAKKNSYVREEFLISFSYFIRKCIYANFVHPDFHLGNLLIKVTKDDLKFVFVDPDGVKFKTKRIGLIKQGVGQLLASLITHELTREEGCRLLRDANIIKSEDGYDDVWLMLRTYDVATIKDRWRKRKKKILKSNSRFVGRVSDESGNKWLLRKNLMGKPILNKEILDISWLEKQYSTEVLAVGEAKRKWLLSFYMQFLGIPHLHPLALYLSSNNQESILIYEKFNAEQPSAIPENDINLIRKLCETAGVKVDSYSRSIVYKGKKPVLREYSYTKKL